MSIIRTDKDGVAVFSKIAAVLDAISTGEMVNVTQLGKKLDMPRSTVHRILSTLVAHDVLTEDHQPGNRLILWAHQALKTSDLREAAMPVLTQLVTDFKETASIYVRVGDYRICLERVEGVGLLRHTVVVGESMPLHKGSGGRILLAWLDKETRDHLWDSSIKRFNPDLQFDEPDWHKVQRDGWTVSMGERDASLASVSVPIIYGKDDAVIGALCVSGPLDRIVALNVATLADAMKQSVVTITAHMAG